MSESGSEWLALAAFWPSLAVAFAGYRATRVAHFRDRLELLEKENEDCRDQVQRLREDNEWLMKLAQRQHGVRRPPWPKKEPEES